MYQHWMIIRWVSHGGVIICACCFCSLLSAPLILFEFGNICYVVWTSRHTPSIYWAYVRSWGFMILIVQYIYQLEYFASQDLHQGQPRGNNPNPNPHSHTTPSIQDTAPQTIYIISGYSLWVYNRFVLLIQLVGAIGSSSSYVPSYVSPRPTLSS